MPDHHAQSSVALPSAAPTSRTGRCSGFLTRAWRSTAVRLGLLAFVVFNVNLRSIASADTFPTRYLPISILTEGDLDLDEFPFLRRGKFPMPGDEKSGIPYFLKYRRGHWMSTYPVMPAILATPVYAVPVLLGLQNGPPVGLLSRAEVVGTLLAKIAAAAAVAASVAIVYRTIVLLIGARAALPLTLIYAFATSAWSVLSQGLWQGSVSAPALSLALYALVRARASQGTGWSVIAGVAMAATVACRPPMAVFAVVMTLYMLLHARRQSVAFLVGPAVIGALVAWYNLYYFGELMGGYRGLAGAYVFTLEQLAIGLRGLLVSPSRGMLVFSPILAFSFVGALVALSPRERRREPLLAYVAAAVLVSVVLYAFYDGWPGAWGFSYRLLAELLPALVLLLTPVWAWMTATRPRVAGLSALATYSVVIQIIGAFYFPCGWYRSLFLNPAAMQRYFSWRDSEVVQCLRAGPVDPDGLRVIRQMLGLKGGGRVAE